MTESEFWRSQGYEWVEGGEGNNWQYTGRFPTPAPTRDASLGQFKIAAEGAPKTLYEQYTEGAGDLMAQGYRPSAQALPTSIEGWAGWTPTNLYTLREGGEGSSFEYAVNPYQETAKLIAAQPKSISPEELVKKYPSLAQLPKSTINAMAGDWRNVYGQMTGFLSPAKTKEGYEAFRPIVQYGAPTLSLGGEGELLPEFAKYVTYSPEYGLVVPQGAYRPYKEKLGIMSLAPMIAVAAALGPLAGALGGGVLGAAGAGAITGGLTSAISGGDVLKGALTGGVTGGFGAAATPIVGGALQSAGITGLAADVLTKAAVSAGTAALQGGDPLQAALVSAVGTGVGGAVGGLEMLKDLDPAIAKAVTAAASGAARAAVGGGDPVAAALSSVANVVGKSALEALPGSAPSTAAPVTPDPDILSQLGAQEAEAQQLQQLLSDAGITTPEQRGLLAGDYKQEGMGDVLARGAESVLGALIPSAQAAGQDRLVLPQPTETDGAQPSDYKYFFDVMSKGDPQSAYAGLAADEKAAVDRAGQEFQASSQDRQLDLLASYRTGQFAPKETPTESWIDRGMLGAEPGASMPDILEMLEQQQAQQQSMQKAVSEYSKPENVQPDILNVLNRKQADTDAAIAALEQATGQKITAGDADILARLAEQGASQSEMEAALRGEIGGMGETFQRNLQQALAQQKASQAETEAALRGEIGGLGQTFDQRVTDLMKQGRDYQSATNQALIEVSRGQEELGGKVAGLETTFDKRLADILAQQGTSQAEMEAALRGEIGGLGTTFDKRLSDILAQQEREQSSMQTALSGYDQRIVDLMRQGESEQEAMRRALEESQATTQQQISGVQTGLGQQISGLGKTLGEALSGVTQQFGATTQGLQQQISQAQQQAGMGNLLAMLGLMQQGKQEAPPIPLVGEIKPFEFSTDLLEGIYQPKQTGLLGANDQLLKMTRG